MENRGNNAKSIESWIWDAACSIRGAQDASKYKDFILPLVFTKRLCDVFDDELNRIAEKLGSRDKAFKLVTRDQKLVRFFLPLKPKDPDDSVWSVIRKLSDKIGEKLTTHLRDIAKANPLLQGIIDRIDFNATTHSQRDLEDDRLSNLIEKISEKRLGLKDVEPDIIGRSYEYLIRKFAEGSGQSAGEFYTPAEVGMIMARIMAPSPGMTIYDPCCGSAGLLIKCELVLNEQMMKQNKKKIVTLKLFGQEYVPNTWAMANMNMIIHDMEGRIEIGDTFRNPKFREAGRLQKFDRVVANPMWNQEWFTKKDYDNDELDRFPIGIGYPGSKADWGWMQHILASMSSKGKAAIILGTGSASRGSGEFRDSQEREARKYFIENDLIEAVILLPFNLFYNTDAPGLIYILNKAKRNDLKGRILFINATKGYNKGKPKNIMNNEWVAKVNSIYHGCEEQKGISRKVPIEEIRAKDYHLRPSRYVYEVVRPEGKPIKKSIDFYQQTISKAALCQKEINNLLGSVMNDKQIKHVKSPFGDIRVDCNLEPLGELVSEYVKRANTKNYPVLSCSKLYGIILQKEKFKSNIASTDQSNYKIVRSGMFAYDPMLLWDGSIGLNRYEYDGIVSPAYTVFQIKKEKKDIIDPYYLEFVLRSPILYPFYVSVSDGTNMRRRKAKFSDFCTLKIPILSIDYQKAITATVKFHDVVNELANNTHQLCLSVLHDGMIGCEG